MSETLIASGDQAMVQLGIKIQRDAIADMLSGRMIASMANQTAAYERLGKDVDYTQVGTALRANLEQIYTDAETKKRFFGRALIVRLKLKRKTWFQNMIDKEEFLLDTEDMPAFDQLDQQAQKSLGLLPPEPSAVVAAQKGRQPFPC